MEPTVSSSTPASTRRLLLDRRYGWVFDEWKEPSEECLAGGRGMFCVIPLAKSLLMTASESINLAATSAVKVVFENPDLLSPRRLQATLGNQIENFNSFHFPNSLLVFKGNSAADAHLHSDAKSSV